MLEETKNQSMEQENLYTTVEPVAPLITLTAPDEVYAACDINLLVNITFPVSVDQVGGLVEIVDNDTILQQLELSGSNDESNDAEESDLPIPQEPDDADEPEEASEQEESIEPAERTWATEVVLTAPLEPGEYTWEVRYTAPIETASEEIAPEQVDDLPPEPIVASFTFTVKPHKIILSSWDVPFPVTMGSKFNLKAGARCVGNCKLAGEQIMLYDQQGVLVSTGVLGEEPRKDTNGVYWVELEVSAPEEAGVYEWELKFPKLDKSVAHDEASVTFVFRAARPSEHLVTIEVVAKGTETPVAKALVAIASEGATYRGWTDDAGTVNLNLPKGEHNIFITAKSHLEYQDKIIVDSDQTIKTVMTFMRNQYDD